MARIGQIVCGTLDLVEGGPVGDAGGNSAFRLAGLLGACASGDACESPFAGSPQFDRAACTFRNADGVDLRSNSSAVSIWWRMFFGKPDTTVPVDPLPVRDLDRAALDALDPPPARHGEDAFGAAATVAMCCDHTVDAVVTL